MNNAHLNGKAHLTPLASVDPGDSPIGTLDDYLSPITQQELDDRAKDLAKTPLRKQARMLLTERLKALSNEIGLRELDDATDETRARVREVAEQVVQALVQRGLAAKGRIINEAEARALVNYLMASMFGAGDLEPLFHASDVEDIIINTVPTGRRSVKVEVWTFRQSGKRREQIELTVDDVIEIVNRAARAQGRQLSPTTPILNARMPNGSRINAVLNPVCHPHLSVTIRVHRLVARTLRNLVQLGTLSEAAADYLALAIRAKLAVCVGGGTSSGKTNFLNALVGQIDPDERIVAIEDTLELNLDAVPDRVRLITVESQDGQRTVSQRQLVANALRMRPDRIILGEVRDGAAFDAIKATNTGHDGSLLTVHAEDAESVPKRLTQLCREASETANMPERSLKEQIAGAFQLIVFLEKHRQRDGSFKRQVVQINELNGFVQHDQITQERLFAMQDGCLIWTHTWPHDRIKQRIVEAGFSQRDIEEALHGRLRLWEEV